MVFIDGELLTSKGWEGELDPHSFYIDYKNGYVYIGADPANHLVEITAQDSALVRTSGPAHGKVSDGKGPVIRGLTFTQYAYRALEIEGKKHFTSADEPTNEPVGISDPATYGKEVTHTLIENVTISYCSHVAGYFRGDGLVIRNSLISDTSTEGIYVIGSSDVLIEKNIVRRNNFKQLTGYFPSAVKIFNQTWRVTFRDNLVDGPAVFERRLVRRGKPRRRHRRQLGRKRAERHLHRDLARRHHRRQRGGEFRQRTGGAQLRRCPRLQQHLYQCARGL